MTAGDGLPLERALGPVRRALVEDAAVDAARIVAEAHADRDRLVAEAIASADDEVAAERRRAEASSRAHTDRDLAIAQRAAHTAILEDAAAIRCELIEDVHRAIGRLRDDPRYPVLLDRLEQLARSQLGEDAVIERDPEPDGGIVAVAGARRVDYGLPALADRALDALAEEVATLWT